MHTKPPVHRTALSRRDCLLALAAATVAQLASAQTAWPARPVRLVVPFSPGGAGDTSARRLGQRIATALGQSVVVENRTGGNAVVAAQAVLQSERDGYTFIWDAANQLTNQVLVRNLPFDYKASFTPVSLAVRAPQALIVKGDFPARTLEEFIAAARSQPQKITVGTPPSGAMGHLALALFQQRAGIRLVHTPYRGGADAARDVMGGQIDAALLTVSTARGTLADGRARMLAVTSAQRNPAFPEVPTIAERGFPGYDMDDWFGIFAAAGTPDAAIRGMQAATAVAVKDTELREQIAPLGMELVGNSTAEFAGWLDRQRDVLHQLIRDANISLG
jgi:tripartite-type tricarboxylate transporter receptor subunit TctC